MVKDKVKVEIIESEREWGQCLGEVKEFNTIKESKELIEKFNSEKIEETTPDWYVHARLA